MYCVMYSTGVMYSIVQVNISGYLSPADGPGPSAQLAHAPVHLQTVQYRCTEPVISHRGHLVDPPTQPGAGAAPAVAREVEQLVVRHRPDHHLLAWLARVADPGQAGGQHPELVLAAGDEVCHRGLGVDGGF